MKIGQSTFRQIVCAQGLLVELLLGMAIAEALILEGESKIFLSASGIGLLVLCTTSFISKIPILVTLLGTLITTIGLCAASATATAAQWHDNLGRDNLVGDLPCPISADTNSALASLALCFLFAIPSWRSSILEYSSKLAIYGGGILFFIYQFYTINSALVFDCESDQVDYSILTSFCLPAFYSFLALFSQRLYKVNIFHFQTNISLGAALLPLLVLACAYLQAWQSLSMPIQKIAATTHVLNPSQDFLLRLLISEDPVFYKHFGVDLQRIKEATQETLRSRRFVRGGSTISMQLFKVVSGQYEKTLWRKLVQAFGAVILEQRFSKPEILRLYLETVSFGPGVIGISQASREYFGKNPNVLSAEEAQKLVLALYNPITYNPAMSAIPREAAFRAAVIETRLQQLGPKILEQLRSQALP